MLKVRPAVQKDAVLLQAIERLAGNRFRGIGLPEVADDDPPSVEKLERYATDGRGWVVLGTSSEPVGYVVVSEVDGHVHIDQMSVRPDHQGLGAGRVLIETVRTWALETDRAAITLTTYADVPWNRPLYEHLGFRLMTEDEIGAELDTARQAERAAGLDRCPRVCLILDLAGQAPTILPVTVDGDATDPGHRSSPAAPACWTEFAPRTASLDGSQRLDDLSVR